MKYHLSRTGHRAIAVMAGTAVAALAITSAAFAATSAGGSPGSGAARVASAAIPECAAALGQSGNVGVWVADGQGSGAAGTIYYPLEFTNTSNHTCRTWGYPGVSALNAGGKQLGDAAGRNPLYAGAWVNIPAGGTAHSLMSYGNAEVSTSGCKPATASLIKVYPPNQFSAALGFFSLPVCTLTHHVYLHVTVLRPGTNI